MKRISVLIVAMAFAFSATAALAATPLVDAGWVKSNIGKPNVVFLDVRGLLGKKPIPGQPKGAKPKFGPSNEEYVKSHVPGAIWTNYLKDGWRIKDTGGTVGQMPSVAHLEKLIGGIGIGNDDHVVVIPRGGSALDVGTATRIYFTFKYLGHDKVSVLNGGMKAYLANAGNPTKSGVETRSAKAFKGSARPEMLASKTEMNARSKTGALIVDNRPTNQYQGKKKHGKSKRAGTIPGAKNVPESRMTKNGIASFKDKAELAAIYKEAGVSTEDDNVTFCNTGHWASLGWFVSSEIMGNKKTRMYDGSMVEWSADKSLPIQTK